MLSKYSNFKNLLNLFFFFKDILADGEDFENGSEVYEAIGEVLHEISEKSEEDIRYLLNLISCVIHI